MLKMAFTAVSAGRFSPQRIYVTGTCKGTHAAQPLGLNRCDDLTCFRPHFLNPLWRWTLKLLLLTQRFPTSLPKVFRIAQKAVSRRRPIPLMSRWMILQVCKSSCLRNKLEAGFSCWEKFVLVGIDCLARTAPAFAFLRQPCRST